MRQFEAWAHQDLHFPHGPLLDVGNKHPAPYQLVIERLTPFLLERRMARIEKILGERTYSLIPILENIDDLGNAHAVMRSAEAMGLQSLHVISGQKIERGNAINIGSDKWLDTFQWEDSAGCLSRFREQGYRLIGTTLKAGAKPIEEVDFSGRVALIFGNEHEGISPLCQEMCDEFCFIPMRGFSKSFNVSVAAAMCLYVAVKKRQELGPHGDLLAHEKEILRAHFYKKSVKFHPGIFRDFKT